MNPRIALALALAAMTGAIAAGQAIGTSPTMAGVENPTRARANWILKCQGCHRADASGTPATTPAMAGIIGRFVEAPGGRAYLAQVPGVATAALPDAELAELLNWTLQRFDPQHMPRDFKPYTSAEIGQLRRSPLRADAPAARARIVRQFPSE